MQVESVEEEAVGPQAALAVLGPEWQDAISLSGPVVLVTATLPQTTFRADGEDRPLFSGMQGTAEVCVRKRPILLVVVPGLDAVLERLGR
jgi:membrane fusion protein (multidrug efflux system)